MKSLTQLTSEVRLMPYDYDKAAIVNGNMHILVLVDPIIEKDDQSSEVPSGEPSVIQQNAHVITLVTPIVDDNDLVPPQEESTEQGNIHDIVFVDPITDEEPVIEQAPFTLTMSTPIVDSVNITDRNQYVNTPYNSNTTSVVNENFHVLTLSTPVVRDGGPMSYVALYDKPMINGIELIGNISLSTIGAQPAGNYPFAPLTIEDCENIIRNEL
jgi:hypothetical protein